MEGEEERRGGGMGRCCELSQEKGLSAQRCSWVKAKHHNARGCVNEKLTCNCDVQTRESYWWSEAAFLPRGTGGVAVRAATGVNESS